MVERSLSMREVLGSMPRFSTSFLPSYYQTQASTIRLLLTNLLTLVVLKSRRSFVPLNKDKVREMSVATNSRPYL